jgi:anti-anti-sigma regulatory factor
LSITLKRDPGGCVLQLEGEIDVRCAAELKQVLLEALTGTEGAALQIDLAQTTALDITALQLLWAGGRDAAQKQIVLSLAEPVPEGIVAIVCEAGFEKRLLPSRRPPESLASPGSGPCP